MRIPRDKFHLFPAVLPGHGEKQKRENPKATGKVQPVRDPAECLCKGTGTPGNGRTESKGSGKQGGVKRGFQQRKAKKREPEKAEKQKAKMMGSRGAVF